LLSVTVTEQVAEEALSELAILEHSLRSFEIERLLSNKYDRCSCGMTIQSGAGGTEAQDWAGMLLRMYKRYAERKGFKVKVVDEAPADFGIKSTEVRIEGEFAYGLLNGEKGTHRLVRMSPFNAQGKRQTSFAGVETWPILPEEAAKDVVLLDKVMRVSSVFSSELHCPLYQFATPLQSTC
jgi:peptide chain release factor 2